MALAKKLQDFQNALHRLQEAHTLTLQKQNTQEYSFYRDSTIQRFQFTLEIAWKSIKSYLFEKEGIECRSPKSCIREFFATAAISPDDTQSMLEMVDDRNLATHTYHEALADEIFQAIGTYIPILQKTFTIIRSRQSE